MTGPRIGAGHLFHLCHSPVPAPGIVFSFEDFLTPAVKDQQLVFDEVSKYRGTEEIVDSIVVWTESIRENKFQRDIVLSGLRS